MDRMNVVGGAMAAGAIADRRCSGATGRAGARAFHSPDL